MNFSKYKAKRSTKYGVKWSSLAELHYYETIKDDFKEIELQPKIYLTDAKILYRPDFKVVINGKVVYLEVKGMETSVWKIKKRLYRAYCKDELRIIKRSGKKFKVVEVINGNT